MTSIDLAAMLARHEPRVVAIGASAGAIEALGHILPRLPAAFPAPILIVIHVPPDRPSQVPALFAERCALPVREAEDKSPLAPGVYFAPPDYHLLVERTGTLALSNDEAVHFSRPAIDVLFESLAAACGARGLGILLSGASQDGAVGLEQIRRAGGLAWVQSPATAAVATMPEAALARAPHVTLAPDEIGEALAAWGRRGE